MVLYRLAGQEFYFPHPIHELETVEVNNGAADEAAPFVPPSCLKNESGPPLCVPASLALSCQTVGWVANAQRQVEIWLAPPGILLRVAGGSDFYISPGGQNILCASQEQDGGRLNETDRQILLGPVLVLALAMRGTWCLHASAVVLKDHLIAFLGEAGEGKSTLAAFLANVGDLDWRLVADDILPVTLDAAGALAWPHFPQLKLPLNAQPGYGMPESLPLDRICILRQAELDIQPELQLLPMNQAVQVLVSHTAGTRLFEPTLLSDHLDFCARVATKVPVYSLIYPHRKDILPAVKEILESLC